MKIRHKITLSLLGVLSLLSIVTISAYLASNNVDYYRKRTLLLEDKLVATTGLRAQVRNQLLETYEVAFIEGLKEHANDIKQEKDLVQKKFSLFENSIKHEKISGDISSLRTEYNKLDTGLNNVVTLVIQGKIQAAKNTLLEARKNNFDNGFIKTISSIMNAQKLETQKSSQNLAKSILNLQRLLIVFSILSFIIVMALIIFISKSIGQRLLKLEEATRKIAEGHYDIELVTTGADEISILSKAFNQMASSLLETKEKLTSQQEIITHTSKMSALGEMAGSIAHEINTPLAAIILNAELIDMQNADLPAPSQEISDHSKAIIDISNRVAKIILGLRGFSRDATNDEKELFTLKELITMTTNLCNEKLKNHGVQLKIEENFLETQVSGQIVQLSQTLLNLLNNSYDAIQNLDDKWINIKITLNEKVIELKVTDSGSPLPSKLVEKIFNPFFTTKDVGEGTGLGLSISKNIAKQHGGDLLYDHTSPYACFVIQLPRI